MDPLQVRFKIPNLLKKSWNHYDVFFLLLVLDGNSEDSSSGPLALAVGTEDSSEATNDSSSVAIHSEETSREPATNGNGNGNDTTNDNTTTNDDTTTEAPSMDVVVPAPTNGSRMITEAVSAEGDNDNAVADQDELVGQPSSKKIRLHEPVEVTSVEAVAVAEEEKVEAV